LIKFKLKLSTVLLTELAAAALQHNTSYKHSQQLEPQQFDSFTIMKGKAALQLKQHFCSENYDND